MSTDDDIERRKKLTFEEAEGLHPLPRQLAPTEVSKELRAVLWNYVHNEIDKCSRSGTFQSYIGPPWSVVLKHVHVFRDHLPVDEFSTEHNTVMTQVRAVFLNGSHSDIYGWLQFVMRIHRDSEFTTQISAILLYCRAPYRVVDGTVIYPIGSEAEANTIERAFKDIGNSEMSGAREHLRGAATELTQGHYADSIRESIHAVESVVRVLEPKGDFAKALARLETKAKIHGAMKAAFGSLYGFTSDEKGIRHPLLDKGAADVDETDALFMIGACAAFVSYLLNKARAAGLIPQ